MHVTLGLVLTLETSVSRILFRRRGILHRDLSKNNILIRNRVANYTGPLEHDLEDMCFSQYLLDESVKNDNVASE